MTNLPATSLADSFRAMKAAEAARNGWWAEGQGLHRAGRESAACDDAASAQDERAQAIRAEIKAAILGRIPGWTEAMVQDVFG
ncbi:hypothetical protein [Sphingomonas sp. MMS24-J13]|uniref:hypothetical protein n=1 Tax=Sphingomonas sp. MMS24-J13 TaxID=3238686 RepID=UPI00384CAA4F